MFEIDKSNSFGDTAVALTKAGFDIIRNTLIVATLGYFYEKTKSDSVHVLLIISQILLGAYIAAPMTKFKFAESLFSDTVGGRRLRIALSTLVFATASLFINYVTGILASEAVKAQSRDPRCSIPFSSDSRKGDYGTGFEVLGKSNLAR